MSKNFDIKPKVKVSKAQKAALAERMMSRQASHKAMQPSTPTPTGTLAGPGGSFMQMPEQGLMPSQVSTDGLGVQQKSYDISQAKPLASAKIEVPEAHELAAYAAIGAQLWKDMGGHSSLGSRVWKMFAERAKSHHEDPRDYFISSYVAFQAQPEKFAQSKPNEARLLAVLQEQFEKSQPATQVVPQRDGPLANLPPRAAMPAGGGEA